MDQAKTIRIKSIEANNFKSLVDFKVEFAPFNCLIGLNGSGKSTVLQFIDFVSQLVGGDITHWLSERKWDSSHLKSKLTKKKNIDLRISFADEDDQGIGHWEASYNPSMARCTQEKIGILSSTLEVSKGEIYIKPSPDLETGEGWKSHITFDYQGSILSVWKDDLLPQPILKCRQFLREVKSLDLLSPEYLRQRTRESSGSLGLGGQKLAAFLYELGPSKCLELTKQLKAAYPQLQNLGIKSLRAGWKQLEITESYKGEGIGFFPQMTTEARHINDGMLRLIAILAELQSHHRFLLFDEIENGINPELVEFVIEALTSTDKQVLVTTHSPMILNYLSDEAARSGVIYLYKTPAGVTKAIRYFAIPSIAEKLTVMGPGEVFVDTNLTDLTEEIRRLTLEAL